MNDTAIKVRGLGKKYYIGEKLPQHSLIESIKTAAGFPWQLAKSMFTGEILDKREEFWALKDVSFDVKQGDIIGIIGRNGAGKSTLLKLLSRITAPTEGEIEIFGRVGSLLEVGTGFHPELTGYENIFLSGSLLGMTAAEIKKRFDEIVDFSGVERFLDTPVKFYSSGMHTRLAFSVAAHLNPEILIVDEVLAVGDADFQKKCLAKISDISQSGRTILFVSHNMESVKNLCNNGILLEHGMIKNIADCDTIITQYLQAYDSTNHMEDIIRKIQQQPADRTIRYLSIGIFQNGSQVLNSAEDGQDVEVMVNYEVFQETIGLRIILDIMDYSCNLIIRSFHDGDNDTVPITKPGIFCSKVIIPGQLLGPTNYIFSVKSTIHNERYCVFPEGISFQISFSHTSKYNRAYPQDTFRGQIAPVLEWKTVSVAGKIN